MLSRRTLLIGLGVLTGTAAAGVAGYAALPRDDGDGSGPPSIRFGVDVCAYCGMVIADRRFAAAWRGPDDVRRFDDVGCLVMLFRRQGVRGRVRAWVADYRSERLVPAEGAGFVVGADVNTPMAYRLVAAATFEDALALTRELGGKAVDWRTLIDSWAPEEGR